MKFLLSMIFCFPARSSTPAIHHQTFSSQRTKEIRSLMRQSSAVTERTITSRSSRGGKLTGIGSKSMSATNQWKPSLCAISEDKAVYVVAGNGERTRTRTSSEKKLAGKSSEQKSKIRVRDFNHNDFNRRAPAMNIIPAFTPTMFMF